MAAKTRAIDKELVQRVRNKVMQEYEQLSNNLVVSEFDLPVITALSDEELERLILLALEEAKKPVSWRELKRIFVGIAGEDRLRKIISKLKAENVIVELTKTRYALPQYVPLNELSKVKNPGILSKILSISEARQ